MKTRTTSVTPSQRLFIPWRYRIGGLLFCCHVINYADRVNISVAIVSMADEYGYSSIVTGKILAAFFYGYFVTQFLGGIIASPTSKIGPKCGLIAACILWSTLSALTPLCADSSLELLMVARVGLGLAEGVYVPLSVALIARWFPTHERGRFAAVAQAGQYLGAVVALASAPVSAYDWRLMFYIFGAFGFLWAFVFAAFGSDDPDSHFLVSEEERTYIQCHLLEASTRSDDAEDYGSVKTELGSKVLDASYLSILQTSAFWAPATAHTMNNWSFYLLLSWLPQYFVDVFETSRASSGWFAMMPYIAGALAVLVWAQTFDTWLESGWLDVRSTRAMAVSVGTLGPMCFVFMLLLTSLSAGGASALITATVAVQCATGPGYQANFIDIGGRVNAGRVAAVSNTLATVPGILGNLLVGVLLQPGSGGWAAVFATMILAYMVSFVVFNIFAHGSLINFEKESSTDFEKQVS